MRCVVRRRRSFIRRGVRDARGGAKRASRDRARGDDDDLGGADERASGYFGPDAFDYDKIHENCGGRVECVIGARDSLVPAEMQRALAVKLRARETLCERRDHFFTLPGGGNRRRHRSNVVSQRVRGIRGELILIVMYSYSTPRRARTRRRTPCRRRAAIRRAASARRGPNTPERVVDDDEPSIASTRIFVRHETEFTGDENATVLERAHVVHFPG